MADFNSSLPVRTQTNGDVVVKLSDGTTNTQLLSIDASGRITSKLDDGTGNPITSQVNGAQRALDVGIDVAGVQVDPRAIRALTSADVVTANQGTANATPWNENIAQIAGAVPSATNALPTQIATAGAFVSNTNPLPVTVTSSAAGTAIQDYHTSASLAAAASVTFTYTVVAAHTFNLQRVWASASGKIKVVVQLGASTIFAGFNSTATPNIDITVTSPPTIAAAGTVNVIITNDDVAAMDVYATIEGNQN